MAWNPVRRAGIFELCAGLLLVTAMGLEGAACTAATAEGATGLSAQRPNAPSAASVSTPQPASGARSRETGAAPSTVASQPDRANTRVFYDLVAHRDDAEMYQGRSLIVDFGSSADAKYTLGGWGRACAAPR